MIKNILKHNKRNSAYTLLETVVVLFLLVLILHSLLAFGANLYKYYHKTSSILDVNSDAVLYFSLIKKELNNAESVAVSGDNSRLLIKNLEGKQTVFAVENHQPVMKNAEGRKIVSRHKVTDMVWGRKEKMLSLTMVFYHKDSPAGSSPVKIVTTLQLK